MFLLSLQQQFAPEMATETIAFLSSQIANAIVETKVPTPFVEGVKEYAKSNLVARDKKDEWIANNRKAGQADPTYIEEGDTEGDDPATPAIEQTAAPLKTKWIGDKTPEEKAENPHATTAPLASPTVLPTARQRAAAAKKLEQQLIKTTSVEETTAAPTYVDPTGVSYRGAETTPLPTAPPSGDGTASSELIYGNSQGEGDAVSQARLFGDGSAQNLAETTQMAVEATLPKKKEPFFANSYQWLKNSIYGDYDAVDPSDNAETARMVDATDTMGFDARQRADQEAGRREHQVDDYVDAMAEENGQKGGNPGVRPDFTHPELEKDFDKNQALQWNERAWHTGIYGQDEDGFLQMNPETGLKIKQGRSWKTVSNFDDHDHRQQANLLVQEMDEFQRLTSVPTKGKVWDTSDPFEIKENFKYPASRYVAQQNGLVQTSIANYRKYSNKMNPISKLNSHLVG